MSTTAPLSLGAMFDGIGGLSLGLERAGMSIEWNAEIDPYACRVLARHWPTVPNLGDVTTIDWSTVARTEVICGGFPCQDISNAHTNGVRAALAGRKSGLWTEYLRAVVAVRPRWVVVENVAAWQRWVPGVRGDLHGIGYASLPILLPAGLFGAPHPRPRVFVVAHTDSEGEPLLALHEEVARLRAVPSPGGHWREPFAGAVRVDDGVPHRMDRLRACGNAVVPQVSEWLGRQIVAIDEVVCRAA